MAHVNTKNTQLSNMPQTLHQRESKSVATLLRENPYVAGLALVRATDKLSMSPASLLCANGRASLRPSEVFYSATIRAS